MASKYLTYSPELDLIDRMTEEHGIPVFRHFEHLNSMYMEMGGHPYSESLDAVTHVCEYGYRQERNIIFLEDQSTIDFLMSLRFKTPKQGARIPLPHESFSLAVPSGLKFKGVSIPPVLVYAGEKEVPRLSVDMFTELGLVKTRPPESVISEACGAFGRINIIIPEKAVNTPNIPKNLLRLTDETLIELLGVDFDDSEIDPIALCRSIVGTPLNGLSDEEVHQQMVVLRLIVSLGIYNNATENKYLRQGVPYGHSVKKAKNLGLTKQIANASSFSSLKLNTQRKGTGEKVVAGFMRNLQHERYYQGRYKDFPEKSRWVEVEGWVTGSAKAETQNIK